MTPLERVLLNTMLQDVAVIRSNLAVIVRDMADDHEADRVHVNCLDTAFNRLDAMAGKVNEILDKMPEGK